MKTIEVTNYPIRSVNFIGFTGIFVASSMLPMLGLVTGGEAILLVGAIAGMSVVLLAASRRKYEVNEEMVVQYPPFYRKGEPEQRRWATIKKITDLDDRGETTPSVLFEFPEGKGWELNIKSAEEREAILGHAAKMGVAVEVEKV